MYMENNKFIPAVMAELEYKRNPCFEFDYIGEDGIDMRRLFEVEQEEVGVEYGYIPEDYSLWSRSDYEQMKKEGNSYWLEVLKAFEDPTVEWVITNDGDVDSVYHEKYPKSVEFFGVELTYLEDLSPVAGEIAYGFIEKDGLVEDLFTDVINFDGDTMRELAEWLLDGNEVSLPLFIQSIEQESGGKKLNWSLKEEMERSLEGRETLQQEISNLDLQEAYERFNAAKERWLPQVPLRVEVEKHIRKTKGIGI